MKSVKSILQSDRRRGDNYIWVEILNIRSLGTKLILATEADPDDSYFDVVLISERQRNKLINLPGKDGERH